MEPIVSLPQPSGSPMSSRQRYQKRKNALWNERNSYLAHWRELSEQIHPRKTRFFDDRPNVSKRNDKLINSTPRWAMRVLSSGMMAGVTSPSRPWFNLTLADKDLADYAPVREWLYKVETQIRMTMLKSNIYNCLHNTYEDLGGFAVSALHVERDLKDTIRGTNFPVGQYALSVDERGTVNTIYRCFNMTIEQMVRKFGINALSERAKTLATGSDLNTSLTVTHAIEPNDNPIYGKKDYTGMPFKACFFEEDAPMSEKGYEGFLQKTGYREFPTMCPRWFVNGENVYGDGPGMDILGDCKQLQFLEKMKAQLVHKIVVPPMVGPSSLANRRISLLPGDITLVDSTAGVEYKPAIIIPPQALPAVSEYIMQHEERIKRGCFADLWLMLSESDRREMTAAEVAERHSEKLLQLGPVMERLQRELLEPLIDRIFMILLRAGLIPPPPKEIMGHYVDIEYVSIMAQAQKMVVTGSIERMAGFLGQVAAVRPDILDNLDWDKTASTYAEALGLPPDLVLSDEQVAEVRQQRADMQRQQQELEQGKVAAEAAQKLGGVKTPNGNMMSDLVADQGGIGETLQ